jgi:hypothetical protein
MAEDDTQDAMRVTQATFLQVLQPILSRQLSGFHFVVIIGRLYCNLPRSYEKSDVARTVLAPEANFAAIIGLMACFQ